MKIMSNGSGVFFIQKDCCDSSGNKKIMPRSSARSRRYFNPISRLRRRVGDFHLKADLPAVFGGNRHFGLGIASGYG